MKLIYVAISYDEADQLVLSQLKEWAKSVRKDALGAVHPEDQENSLRLYGAFMTVIEFFEPRQDFPKDSFIEWLTKETDRTTKEGQV